MNRTKNSNARHRHSLIPVANHPYQVKHRRASAYPVLENNMYKLNNIGPYPIAPMPSLLRHESSHHHHRKPSAIDLLASAAEYVRTDRKEMSYSRT